jgi:hypothetical protein
MENYQCHIAIDNRTESHLKLVEAKLPTGKFVTGQAPKDDILPNTQMKAFAAQGKMGPMGTEGTVVYRLEDSRKISLTIHFNVPTGAPKNKVTASTSDRNLSATVEGLIGKGSTESCTIKLSDNS